MTTKEFEYLKENWDKCIKDTDRYSLIPFDIFLINTFKPDGDYFVCLTKDEFNKHAFGSGIGFSYFQQIKEFIRKLEEDNSFVKTVKIHYKKVQRINGYNKGYRYKPWENNDWRVEVRNDKLKQLGI